MHNGKHVLPLMDRGKRNWRLLFIFPNVEPSGVAVVGAGWVFTKECSDVVEQLFVRLTQQALFFLTLGVLYRCKGAVYNISRSVEAVRCVS